ncbi:unnamed protein product, partial [Polarella glacialis]
MKSRILCPIILLLSLCLAPAAATGTGSGSSADAARCNNGQQAASNRQQAATTDVVNTGAACMLQVVRRLWRQDEQESLQARNVNNLPQDSFFRRQIRLSEDRFVPIRVFTTFNRLKVWCHDMCRIAGVLRRSAVLE